MGRAQKIVLMLVVALAIKFACVALAYELTFSILESFGVPDQGHAALIAYAPEVWLSLLALVFGTLIIVVSIASENTPKLVDMFVGDPVGRLYIWMIMLSTLENIFLQIVAEKQSVFVSNMIFMNNYVMLPASVLLAIPYTFYILKYTKNTNVIDHIFRENVRAIRRSRTSRAAAWERNQLVLFETVNQLHDLLQYTQFKEPKGDVISGLGKSVRTYLTYKKSFPPGFYRLSNGVRNDISFRTMQEKYAQIEMERSFYEHKVLKVFCAIYLLLMKEGHYELASLCGSELVEIGNAAMRHHDKPVTEAVILNFNTLLRYGINHGLKTREIRNAYNIIYYYNQLVHTLMEQRDEEKIETCCTYLGFYAVELSRLRQAEPQLNFLIDAISWELKRNLNYLYDHGFPEKIQKNVLGNICNLTQMYVPGAEGQDTRSGGLRLIKVSLCLFYLGKDALGFVDELLNSIVLDIKLPNGQTLVSELEEDCSTLMNEREAFWEETDQGNRNIYFSSHKEQIPRLIAYVESRMHSYQFAG